MTSNEKLKLRKGSSEKPYSGHIDVSFGEIARVLNSKPNKDGRGSKEENR